MEPTYGIFLTMGGGGVYGQSSMSYSSLHKLLTEDFDTPEEALTFMEKHELPRHQFIILEVY